jgi:DNA-directed RNA polymerase subunit N (RpoN/RPB10)
MGKCDYVERCFVCEKALAEIFYDYGEKVIMGRFHCKRVVKRENTDQIFIPLKFN